MLWIVAAPGPSLTPGIAQACDGFNVIAVNDAYQLFPRARCLYGSDQEWWKARKGVPEFEGEKWTLRLKHYDNENCICRYGLKTVQASRGEGFDFRPGRIHLGRNGGFQAVNLALCFGAKRVIMTGFDMTGTHFFGEHKYPLRQKAYYRGWIEMFDRAAKLLPAGITIINATPGSALTCFPMMTIQEALNASRET
jgi:hypothetical protein